MMNYKELKKQMAESLASLYIFYGEEVFLENYMTERLVGQAVDSDFAEFNHLILTGETLSPDAVSDFFEAYPVMSERKLLQIKDASLFSAKGGDKEPYQRLLSDIPDYVTVLISEDNPDKRSSLYKALSKIGVVCEFTPLDRPELKAHVTKKLSAEKKDISAADLEYLLDLTGSDLTNIRLELDKLIAFSGLREKITRADIDKNISKPLLSKIYDISEAVLSKNGEYAFKIISDLEKNNESALRILSVLASYFSDLYRAYVLSRENMSYPEMVAAMNLPPQRKFVADKMFKRVKNVNPDFLRECISDCTKAESDVKNGVLTEWRALEVLVLKFLNA